MTLYGYAREPDSPSTDDDPSSSVPQQRAASSPVRVSTTDHPPTVDVSDALARPAETEMPRVQPDPWAPPVPAEPDLWAPPVPAEPDGWAPAASDGWGPAAAIAVDQVEADPGEVGPVGDLVEADPAVVDAAAAAVASDAADSPAGQSAQDWMASVPGLDDDDDIVPWDRRPLMIVIAGAVALVVLAILSGVATVNLFRPSEPPAAWQPVGPPAPTGPAATPTPAPGTGAGDGVITLSGVGDVIMGSEPDKLPPNGGAGFFDSVKSALAADVVMGNLETPLTPDTKRVKCASTTSSPAPSAGARSADCYQFYLPPAYAGHLRDGGFTMMNLANNHTNDMGPVGLTNTRNALEAAGVQHTGAVNQITVVEVKGVKVAVLGFAVYAWGQNLNNIPAAISLVQKADELADLVVIQMQGGAEGSDKTHVRPGKETFAGEDRGDLMKFTHAMIDAGADVVFGHGPHVMRGMEFYKGRLIAYSLGNFCGFGVLSSAGNSGVGGVLKVSLNKDGSWAGGQLVPTVMVNRGLPAPDPQKKALALVDGLSKEDFGAAAASISTADGRISPPAAG